MFTRKKGKSAETMICIQKRERKNESSPRKKFKGEEGGRHRGKIPQSRRYIPTPRGASPDAPWSVSRFSVERRPILRGVWADAPWSVGRSSVECEPRFPSPPRGGARGGVCYSLNDTNLSTPPPTPPLRGEGRESAEGAKDHRRRTPPSVVFRTSGAFPRAPIY